LAVASTSACLGPSDFHCTTHAQCGDVTSGSFCEVNGRCSVPDADCALSGRRYVEHAGNDSGACVARACQDNPVAALAAGSTHACLRRLDGTVACWGRNDDGQLGDGTRTPHATAGAVAGLDDAISIAAGDRHTCAVRMGGSVVCWGGDDAGQLGDGGGARRLTPTPVAGVTGARAVAAGDDFSCVLRSNGGVICWGADGAGQLGDGAAGATTQPPTPVVGLPAGVRSIAARGRHACALDDADTVWCWGANDKGQLGDGTTIDRPTPVAVLGLTDIIAVSTGRGHSCAATRNRGLRCWGDNSDDQVAGLSPTEPAPVVVPIVLQATAVAAGDRHTCAIDRPDGVIYCFGANDHGQLGEPRSSGLPAQVGSFGVVRAIVSGGAFSCAITADDAVFCWGDHRWGQLGTGGDVLRPTPVRVPGVVAATAVSAGGAHTCAVAPELAGGATPGIWCWGANEHGQLGDGSTVDRPARVATTKQLSATGIAAGGAHSCAITTANEGDMECWGAGGSGQLGLGNSTVATQDKPYPSMVPLFDGANPRVRVIAAGGAHTCVKAVASASIRCFGANDHGQLGGGPAPPYQFVDATLGATPATAMSVAAGAAHTCALDAAGGVWCWGRGDEGQLGDGARADRSAPVMLALGAGVSATAVAAGGAHSCALVTGGKVMCWGRGDEGQLATAGGIDALVPTEVADIEGALAVVAGAAHTCAIAADRSALCWGANEHGQLGDGGTADSGTPVPVAGLTDVRALAAGGAHTCALRGDGTLSCWGDDGSGQLGDGALLIGPTPQLARITCH
jgi:alpha-tubulin suppressor-like RCC1 family protein